MPPKNPLPNDFTKKIPGIRLNIKQPNEDSPDKVNQQIQQPTTVTNLPPQFYKLVPISNGLRLEPLTVIQNVMTVDMNQQIVQTNTVNCNVMPISSVFEVKDNVSISDKVTAEPKPQNETVATNIMPSENDLNHCKCCILLRSICKKELITDYFKSNKKRNNTCRCRERSYPRISKRLRMLVDRYKSPTECVYTELLKRLDPEKRTEQQSYQDPDSDKTNAEDLGKQLILNFNFINP